MPRTLLLITDLELGGTPTVVRELAVRLPRRGHDIEVACLSKWGPVADQISAAGVPVTALNAAGVRDVGLFRRTIRLISDRQFSTVFSFLIHANTAAAVASRFCPGVHFVQSIQTTQPKPAWHWTLQRLIHHAAERIVVPSPSVAEHAIHHCDVPREKLLIIPNAIDLAAFLRSPVAENPPSPFPLGFLGRLDPVKRVPHLVRTVQLLVEQGVPIHLHVFGEGLERGAIEREVLASDMGGSVTMHGAVANPQQALAQIGALVLPSEAEGFGLVLIEGMASGVPVIGTNVAGIRDVIRHEESGLLADANSVEDLATKIRRIVEDADLRRNLIAGGLRQVRREFYYDAIIPAYEALLADTINPTGTRPSPTHRNMPPAGSP